MNEQVNQLDDFFKSGSTHNYSFRVSQLEKLRLALQDHEEDLMLALHQDLNKPSIEAYASEIGIIYSEISYIKKHLKSWMKPQKVKSPLALFYSKSYIYSVPLGMVLIIAPWNYPVQLLLSPLIGAIAGGNCAVVKPSEYTPNVSKVLQKIINQAFNSNYVLLVEGDGAVIVPELIKQNNFDHVFFTGSTMVGRSIASLCASKLIPYTLELGGKSPAIIDSNINLSVACKRLAWTKFYNAGQTCVAPDYVLVDASIKDAFITELKSTLKKFYPANNISRIINKNRFDKLVNYLDTANIIHGGEFDEELLYIAPTLVDSPDMHDALMRDEVFGPILPILSYSSWDELCSIIGQNPNPLSLYVFSENDEFANKIINNIPFGGGGVNIALLHLVSENLPFGGVRQSGQGHYHGKFSFDTFTHKKAIVKMSTHFDAFFKYPPYTKFKSWLLRTVI
jgi:aldehyde dehydrogenase (NAD+)